MDDLKRVEGKTISSLERDNNEENSYAIIKFKEGGKINIVSTTKGKGVGQLDIVSSGFLMDNIIGKQIENIIEKFDGEKDFLIFNFKKGGNLSINAFGSSEESNAELSYDVYVESKKISESKITISNMIKLVPESLLESINEIGRYSPQKDYAMGDFPGMNDKPYDPPLENIKNPEDLSFDRQISKMLNNELAVPEYDRGVLDFTIKSTKEKISGIPMIKLSGGKAFLFKTDKGMKKIYVNDISLD